MIDKELLDQEKVDQHWMGYALELALRAQQIDEVPVGAVLVVADETEPFGRIIGEGFNQPITMSDATAHAEVNAIRNACKAVNNYRLPNSTLYVTLEPCAMCAGAIVHSRIARVVIAANEPRAGAAGSVLNVLQNEQLNHRCEVLSGIKLDESAAMLKAFFKARRKKTAEKMAIKNN